MANVPRNVVGMDELRRRFATLSSDKVESIIIPALEKSADETVALLKVKTPVSELAPHLRETIEKTSPGKLKRHVSVGNAQSPYAAALEWGHSMRGRFFPPQPFFMSIYRFMTKRTRSAINREVRKFLKNVWGEVR